jgi:hypothetical protein
MISVGFMQFRARLELLDISDHDANTVTRWYRLGNQADALDKLTLWESIERLDADSETITMD